MSKLQTLSPDHRATLELLVRHRHSYASLAQILGVDEQEVRRRARESTVQIAEANVARSDAQLLADYVLRQDVDLDQTQKLLGNSTEALTWTREVEDELRHLASGVSDHGSASASAKAQPQISKRGGAIILAGALAILIAGTYFLTQGSGKGKEGTADQTQSAPKPVAELRLNPEGQRRATGSLELFSVRGKLAFTVRASNVSPNGRHDAYVVWATGDKGTTRLGFVQPPVGADRKLGVTGPEATIIDRFPKILASARSIVVSREKKAHPSSPSEIILRGRLSELKR